VFQVNTWRIIDRQGRDIFSNSKYCIHIFCLPEIEDKNPKAKRTVGKVSNCHFQGIPEAHNYFLGLSQTNKFKQTNKYKPWSLMAMKRTRFFRNRPETLITCCITLTFDLESRKVMTLWLQCQGVRSFYIYSWRWMRFYTNTVLACWLFVLTFWLHWWWYVNFWF